MTLDQDVTKLEINPETCIGEHELIKYLMNKIVDSKGKYSPNGYAEFRYEIDRIEDKFPGLYLMWDYLDRANFRLMH